MPEKKPVEIKKTIENTRQTLNKMSKEMKVLNFLRNLAVVREGLVIIMIIGLIFLISKTIALFDALINYIL